MKKLKQSDIFDVVNQVTLDFRSFYEAYTTPYGICVGIIHLNDPAIQEVPSDLEQYLEKRAKVPLHQHELPHCVYELLKHTYSALALVDFSQNLDGLFFKDFSALPSRLPPNSMAVDLEKIAKRIEANANLPLTYLVLGDTSKIQYERP